MSDHDEGCDYRHGDEPCNSRLTDYDAEIARLKAENERLKQRVGELDHLVSGYYGEASAGWSKFRAAERENERLTAQLTAREWQDIASAPKDGTAVLVVFEDELDYVVGEAEYRGEDSSEGWWWANTYGDYHADRIVLGPTHWMPLPAPPIRSDPPAKFDPTLENR